MKQYKEFRPTAFDPKGAFINDERLEWLVAPVSQNRDSGPLDRSNFECCLKALGGENESVQVHRFGHWGPGWFEIILVKPGTPEAKTAEEIESALADYPVLDDEHFSQLEHEEADQIWKNCYREKDRIEYIREHRSQFEFRDFADLIGCVRGNYFAGYASELIN